MYLGAEKIYLAKNRKFKKRGCNSYGAMLIYNSVINEAVMTIWLHGQAVKTLASHAGIRGSIPLGVTFRISGKSLNYKGFSLFLFSGKRIIFVLRSLTFTEGSALDVVDPFVLP